MSEKVSITKSKLDSLANAIAAVGGTSIPKTLSQMESAVLELTIPPNLQSKTITPLVTQQTVSPDSGYDAFSQVTVNAMPSGSAFTPATTIRVTPTISIDSNGLITANNSGTSSITPTVTAGYITSGTAGTITVSGSNTSQLTTQAASTWTPTTTSQIISSGTYLTGNQTIAGDSNLVASNIASGVSIFGVTGTYNPQPNLESIAVDTTYFPSQSTTIEDGWIGTQIFKETTDTITSQKQIAYSTSRPNLKQCFFSSFTGNTHYKVYGQFEFKWANNDTEIYTININDWNYNNSLDTYCDIPFTWSGFGRSQTFNQMKLFLSSEQHVGVYLYTSNSITDTVTWTSNNYLSFYTIGYDGYESITINLIDNPKFLPIYQSLAYRSSIASSAPWVSEWCNSLSNIKSYQFNGALFNGTFNFNNVSKIDQYAFAEPNAGQGVGGGNFIFNFPSLTSLSFAAFYFNRAIRGFYANQLSVIESKAFQSCMSLTTISFPKCTTISSYAFFNCYGLATASFPECTTIHDYAFYNCFKLTTISFPKCTTIGSYAFQSCSSLTTISFPECTTIKGYAFSSCSNLTTVSFPKCTTINSYAFQNCTALQEVYFPECTIIYGQYVFKSCTSLSVISFPKLTTISAYAFQNCINLQSAYFMGSSIPDIGAGLFQSTPMSNSSYLGYFGSIYVPASLLASYKTATNWTAYSARMVGI